MSSKRRKAREIALKVLYQHDLVGVDPMDCLRQTMVDEVYAPALESFAVDFLRKHAPDADQQDTQEVVDDLLGVLFDPTYSVSKGKAEDLAAINQRVFPLPEGREKLQTAMQRKQKDFSAVLDFARQLVERTLAHLDRINEVLTEFADNWSLDRMAVLDRAILRFSICELLFFREIPINVSINEAVELSKKYSTEKSREFVNGILDKIHRKLNPEKDDPRNRSTAVAEPSKNE